MDIDYPNKEEFETLFFSDLRQCGCGNIEDVYQLLKDVIEIQTNKELSIDERNEKFKQLFTDNYYGVYQFILHTLNGADLMEHGSGVGGSWLTEKGERFLELLPLAIKAEQDEDEELMKTRPDLKRG